MNKIRTQVMDKNSKRVGSCFFDCGDIRIIPETWDYIGVYRNDGALLFETGMLPQYVSVYGCVPIDFYDSNCFEFDSNITKNYTFHLFCFDPRVIMALVLMGWMIETTEYDYMNINIQNAFNPTPSMQEARDFLRTNRILREKPIWKPNRTASKNLIDIPEKIRELVNKRN